VWSVGFKKIENYIGVVRISAVVEIFDESCIGMIVAPLWNMKTLLSSIANFSLAGVGLTPAE